MSELLLPSFVGQPELDKVYHCDALTLLQALPDKSVDCLIADLPYAVGKAEWDYYFPTNWISEGWRVTDRMLIMPGNLNLISAAQYLGRYYETIVMHIVNGMTRAGLGFANWFPVIAAGEWGYKPRPNHFSFAISLNEEVNHPSPKPYIAMKKLIQYYTDFGDVVLDPFAGSGTTLVAAKRLGRRFIGGDLELKYVDVARRRLAEPYTPDMFVQAQRAQAQQASLL